MDTNILIKLYNNPTLFGYEEARIFKHGNTLFTHAICKWEFIKHLQEKGLDENNARIAAGSFLDNHNIILIRPRNAFVPEIEITDFENQVNKKLDDNGKPYLKCHKPDSIILLAFKKCGVNKIISTDEIFREGARVLGIDAENLPSLDSVISRELRKMFNYKKKHRKIR